MRLSLHHRLLIAFLVSTAVVFAVVFALGEINAHALWLQMLGVAFSAIVITVVSRKFSERVAVIVQAAERIARGELDQPLRVDTELPEVNALADTIDRMRESIRHRDEQLLRRNGELREALHHLQQVNRGYLEMLGFVTHELKSPVASMYAAALSLQDGVAGSLSDPQRRLSATIVRNCEYLEDMVKNYLDLSRIEKGEMEVHPQEVDLLDELVVPNIEQLNQQAENRGIRICCDVPAGVILRVDPELARIALGNFLSNAIKYGRERSRIEIRARQYNSQVRVSVWNEGAGFGPEQREKLFRKFGRLSDAQTKRQKGSGLGLYLVREIAERHGGRVGATSEPNEWAEFWLTLPLSDQTKGTLMSDLRKVLLVDDDVDLVDTLKIAMEADGFMVDTAHSGAEGLAKARNNQPEVIVLDVKMETLGEGFQVARELRNDDRTKTIPLIMLSSVNQENMGFRYDADEQWNPVDVFMDKPIKPARLIEEIRKIGADKAAK
jgi:signal transduction histidine kinase